MELSQMQSIANKMGIEVIMTPKAHPELAGQGIEYCWGYAKFQFRSMNTARTAKEKARSLRDNVRAVLSQESLTIERARKFVRKARDYKLVYREHFKSLRALKAIAEESNEAEQAPERRAEVETFKKFHYALVEKQVKNVKAHRAAMDIDLKFIRES